MRPSCGCGATAPCRCSEPASRRCGRRRSPSRTCFPGRWEEIGYPGPLGARADAPAPRLEPIEAADGLELECDVCVVGSGAGGGVAAAVLAQAGLDVVVLEAGGYWSERDFDGAERAGLRRLYRGGGAAATDDQGVGADRRRLPRRGHGRQLHDVLPHAGRRPRGVGGTGLPVGGARAEPRRGLRAARRQHRPQPALAARRGDGARARGARLARRRDAARRRRLRAGRRLRLVRLRLPDRREAVDAAHLARGRRRRRSADRGRREGAARAGRERGGGRRRRRPGPGALPGGRRGRGRDRHAGVAPPLRPDEPERRPRPAAAPGDGGLRHLRGGDPAVGGDAAGALLRPVPLPRRRLRRQVRDGAAAPGAAGGGAAVGGSRGARQADGEPAAALADRRDSARRRRRAGSDRARRRGDRDATGWPTTMRADWRRGSTAPAASWRPPAHARSSPPTLGCSAGRMASRRARSASAPAAARCTRSTSWARRAWAARRTVRRHRRRARRGTCATS